MAQLTDFNKIGQALKTGILQTKARFERKIEEEIMVRRYLFVANIEIH
jgi:hypothetical protein